MILGLVQGLTSILPVSASGHLITIKQLIGSSLPTAFDFFLHAGTLMAVLVAFRKEVLSLVTAIPAIPGTVLGKDSKHKNSATILITIILASVPTAAIGIALNEYFESVYRSIVSVGTLLLINAAVLLMSAGILDDEKDSESDVSLFSAIALGFVQGISLLPGLSRTGLTLIAAVALGFNRKQSWNVCFLLLLPAIFGGFVVKWDAMVQIFGQYPAQVSYGVLFSFLGSFAGISVLRRFIQRGTFFLFWGYCALAGIATLVLGLFTR
jgi:undecaprenyl-diphosphatase